MTKFETYDFEAEADSLYSTPEIPDLTDEQRIIKAVAVAISFGQYDGGHHKQWTLDQVIRILTGSEYGNVIAAYENSTEGEPIEWDTGMAP